MLRTAGIAADRVSRVAVRLMFGVCPCSANHHWGHDQDKAVETYTIAAITKFCSGIDSKVTQLICIICISVGDGRRGLVVWPLGVELMTDPRLDQTVRHHPHVSSVCPMMQLVLGLASYPFEPSQPWNSLSPFWRGYLAALSAFLVLPHYLEFLSLCLSPALS
jgi:hypothetical protein